MELPVLQPQAAAEYDSYTYSGDPCILTAPAASTVETIVLAPAIESGVVSRNPVSPWNAGFCSGVKEYDYIFSGC